MFAKMLDKVYLAVKLRTIDFFMSFLFLFSSPVSVWQLISFCARQNDRLHAGFTFV